MAPLTRLLYLVSLLFLWGCGINDSTPGKFDTTTIKVNLDVTESDVGQLFSDCSIIPLETSNESLFGRVSLIESYDSCFFLYDKYDHTLVSFDKNGKFITNYIKSGKGPGETNSLMSFRVDEDSKRVWVSSWSKKSNIAFNFDGSFILEEPLIINNEGMYRLDENHVAFYTGKPYNIINNEPDYSSLIVIDNSGQITYKGVLVPHIKKSGYILNQSFTTYQDEVLFKYPYGDTIFHVLPDMIIPKYIIDFGENKIDWDKINKENPIKIHFQISRQKMAAIQHYFWEFENWLVFRAMRGGIDEDFYIFYNKATHECSIYNRDNIVNNEYGIFGRIIGATQRELICLVEPMDLIYPESKLPTPNNLQFRQKLSKVLKELESTDNPILLLFEMK